MKKLFQTIGLHKFKTNLNSKVLEQLEGNEYYVLFQDGTYDYVYFKEDLTSILKQDHIKPIRYIFDAVDRIVIDRDIVIKE